MSIGLFGRKIGMTQIFAVDGTSIPVTLVKAENCQVSQIKTVDTEDIIKIEKEISELTNEFSGIEQNTTSKFPVMKNYLTKTNNEIINIDEQINKSEELIKATRAGVSCLIKKGF